MFTDSLLLPSQTVQASYLQAEHRLLMAVLEGGIEQIFSNTAETSHRARHLYDEALQWIYTKDYGRIPFTYCCQHLGLDPDYIRWGITLQIERHSQAGEPVPLSLTRSVFHARHISAGWRETRN